MNLSLFFLLISIEYTISNKNWFSISKRFLSSFKMSNSKASSLATFSIEIPSWEILQTTIKSTKTGENISKESELRAKGYGKPHVDASLRLHNLPEGSTPRLTFFRDTAGWCPYCQKVWMFIEEKKIPCKIEKINMRSYGDKPQSYLKLFPNGLLPAIILDDQRLTESLDIMLTLDSAFSPADGYIQMWPSQSSSEASRALSLMRLERDLFSRWCSLVFRPPTAASKRRFLDGLDDVNRELSVTEGPWFLTFLSIVDLTYLSHIERMCASVSFWTGIKIRGSGRWPAIDRWFDAFEDRPSYLATKSDYYTHVMDIPPQYGPGYFAEEQNEYTSKILGEDGSWKLPLPPFQSSDLEPISNKIDPGDEGSRHEAAIRIANNFDAIIRFALRGAGQPGKKQFSAPLADPYATPALEFFDDMDLTLRYLVNALIYGYQNIPEPLILSGRNNEDISKIKKTLKVSLEYLRDRVGVPRDLSYPAARQLRAYLNWVIDNNFL